MLLEDEPSSEKRGFGFLRAFLVIGDFAGMQSGRSRSTSIAKDYAVAARVLHILVAFFVEARGIGDALAGRRRSPETEPFGCVARRIGEADRRRWDLEDRAPRFP